MSSGSPGASDRGVSGTIGWLLGGAVGGVAGAAVFGILMWAFQPGVVSAAIPSMYGLDPQGAIGWTIHLAHGAVLGLVFGFLVTRSVVLGTLGATVATDALAATGMVARTALAGFVYGLLVWTFIPVLFLPFLAETIGLGGTDEFPRVAVESMIGHAIYGTVLGAVFGILVDEPVEDTDAPFEEPSESVSEP